MCAANQPRQLGRSGDAMRRGGGRRANILRERIGTGDVLKPNIDMGDKGDRTAATLSRGSNSIHR